MKTDPMVQLKELVDYGRRVSVDMYFDQYQVTVFNRLGSGHSHFEGASIIEAMNRAWKSVFSEKGPTP